MYHGVIIEESLENKDVLKKLKILSTTVEVVTDEHKTPWLSQWTLHTIEVGESEAQEVAEKISEALDREHSWYADFKNETHHCIIFRGKVFFVDRDSKVRHCGAVSQDLERSVCGMRKVCSSCKEQYDEVVRHGLLIGIPEYQLDFSPTVGEWER